VTYVDANIFVYASLYDDARAARCRGVLAAIAEGRLPACTSVLSWDEVSWIVERVAGRAAAVRQGERLLRFPGLRFVDCTPRLLAEAQRVRGATGLRPRDALHAASARAAGALEFVTEDSDFDAVGDLRTRRP